MLIIKLLLFISFLFFPINQVIGATLSESLAKDFSPISGYILKSNKKACYIDLGTNKGGKSGDLYAVISPGEKLIHPKTNQVISIIDQVRGYIKITRVYPDYAIARLVHQNFPIKRGQKIRRFDCLRAVVREKSVLSSPYVSLFRQVIPNLEWLSVSDQNQSIAELIHSINRETPTILFDITPEKLNIYDFECQLIKHYPLSQNNKPIVSAIQLNDQGINLADAETQKQLTIQDSFSHIVLFSDFIQHNNQKIIAASDGKILTLYELNHSLKELFTYHSPIGYQIFSVSFWRPVSNRAPYIIVTFWHENEIESSVFDLKNNMIIATKQKFPDIAGVFDLNSDGNPETLLAQSFERQTFWGSRIYKMNKTKNGLTNHFFKVPSPFNVQSSVIADLTGNGYLEYAIINHHTLSIFNGNELIFKTNNVGGGLSSFMYDIDPTAKKSLTQSVEFDIKPVATDIDHDGHLELIYVSNENQWYHRLSSFFTSQKKCKLMALKWQKGMFIKLPISPTINMAIQGVFVIDNQIIVITTELFDLFQKKGKSHLFLVKTIKPK